MQPDELAAIKKRHDAWDLVSPDDLKPKMIEDIDADRGALIEEVDRLEANFDQVIDSLQGYLNHNARVLGQDQSQAIRAIMREARGLR